MSDKGIERYILPGQRIKPLDLEALQVLRQVNNIGNGDDIQPVVDAAYVLKVLEEMTDRLNAVITIFNEASYDEKIQTVASKLNQVVSVLNQNTDRMAKALDEELKELKRDLPLDKTVDKS